jgi:hydroxymethylglutaryl-CoA synthase
LDIAKPNEKIFFVSYGSGAGSDGFIFQTTKNILEKQKKSTKVEDQIANKVYISYPQYLKNMHTL